MLLFCMAFYIFVFYVKIDGTLQDNHRKYFVYDHNLPEAIYPSSNRQRRDINTEYDQSQLVRIGGHKPGKKSIEIEPNGNPILKTTPEPLAALIDYDYEDSVLEQTPDGKYKVVPINKLDQDETNALIEKITKIDHKSKRNATNCRTPSTKSPDSAEILQKIMYELEDIKQERAKCTGKEGLPCKLTGSWVSMAGGVRLDMTVNINGSIHVLLTETIPPKKGFLSPNWTIRGDAPFPKGGPFSLTAWHLPSKKMGNFIGQCRVCHLQEQIYGWWVFGRQARDCKDLHLCGEMRADLFKKEILHALRDEKLNGMHHMQTGSGEDGLKEPLLATKTTKAVLQSFHSSTIGTQVGPDPEKKKI